MTEPSTNGGGSEAMCHKYDMGGVGHRALCPDHPFAIAYRKAGGVPTHVLDTFISSALKELGVETFLVLPEQRIERLKDIMLRVIALREALAAVEAARDEAYAKRSNALDDNARLAGRLVHAQLATEQACNDRDQARQDLERVGRERAEVHTALIATLQPDPYPNTMSDMELVKDLDKRCWYWQGEWNKAMAERDALRGEVEKVKNLLCDMRDYPGDPYVMERVIEAIASPARPGEGGQ